MTQEYEPKPEPNLWVLVWIAVALAIGLAFSSCKSVEYVPVEKVVERYTHNTDTIRDSVYHNVFVKEFVSGDTVFRDKIEYVYKDRWRVRDSIVIQRDSIPVIVTKEVEKKLGLWQRVRLWMFYPLFIMFVFWCLSKVFRKISGK